MMSGPLAQTRLRLRAHASFLYTFGAHVIGGAGAPLEDYRTDRDSHPLPDRNGRHWVRVALSSVLLKYVYKITCQVSSHRALSVIP